MFELIKPFLTADFVGKMVRTAVQSASSSLVAKGIITGDDQTAVAGAIALVASVAWTAIAHSKAFAKAANATTGGLA